VAFNSSNAYVDDVEYTVGAGGSITGDSEMQLPAEGDYTFVAYSLNTNGSPPAYSASPVGLFSANNDDDPLCGSLATHVVEGDNNLTIKMFHQFSKVKVNATTAGLSGTPLIGAITTILPGYKAKLDIQNAGLVKDAAEDQEIGWPTFSPAVAVTSNERKVYAGGGANTYIKISSVTLGGTVYAGLIPAQFVKMLELGKRYTLTLAFTGSQFAGSNIYWKAVASGPQAPGYLTFDGVGVTDHQTYQGVYFKWGSLVGVSAAGTVGVAFDSSTKVYNPEYNSGINPSWNTTNSYSDYYLDIPAIQYGLSGTWDKYNTFLVDDARNAPADWNAKTGDICRYISENGYGPGGNYRMPIGYEFGLSDGLVDYATAGFTHKGAATWSTINTIPEAYADGSYPMVNGGFHDNSGVFFPASGNRIKSTVGGDIDGRLVDTVGKSGYYWSGSFLETRVQNVAGSLSTTYFACSFSVRDNGVMTGSQGAHFQTIVSSANVTTYSSVLAFPVRCVKN
jgi:hypothetical protein